MVTVYAWYSLSGTKSAVQGAKQTKAYVDTAVDSLKVKWEENTPDTDTALKTLRDAVSSITTKRLYLLEAFANVFLVLV